jgi:hypothetical protein
VNLWPTTGWKSLRICRLLDARDTLSGGCGISRSRTSVRRSTADRRAHGHLHAVEQGLEAVEPFAPEGAVEGHPVDRPVAPGPLGGRGNVSGPSRRSRTRPASLSAPNAWRPRGCETLVPSVRARTLSSPSDTAARSWCAGSDRSGRLKSAMAVADIQIENSKGRRCRRCHLARAVPSQRCWKPAMLRR